MPDSHNEGWGILGRCHHALDGRAWSGWQAGTEASKPDEPSRPWGLLTIRECGNGPLDQDEIDQREDRGARANGDQRIIGADVRLRDMRGSGFVSHCDDLGQGGEALCEVDHTSAIFF